jgi:hypothetical protein
MINVKPKNINNNIRGLVNTKRIGGTIVSGIFNNHISFICPVLSLESIPKPPNIKNSFFLLEILNKIMIYQLLPKNLAPGIFSSPN